MSGWLRAGNDRIYGDSGGDAIFGDVYARDGGTLIGGDDLLFSNGGNDTIYGNGGSDSLHGSIGKDELFGEEGHDHFYLDRVSDHRAQPLSHHYGTHGRHDGHPRNHGRRVHADRSQRSQIPDGKGGHAAIHFATLTNKPTLDHGDFDIV